MTLKLHELYSLHFFAVLKLAAALLAEKGVHVVARTVQNHGDVLIAGAPGIEKEPAGRLLKFGRYGVSKPIEGLTQRGAPFLIPAGVAGVTTAIRPPALDAVDTTPGGVFDDLHFVRGRMLFEEIGINGEFGKLLRFDEAQGVTESHIAVGVMVAIGFAIGSDIGQLRPFAVVGEAPNQALRKVLASVENILKGHRMRDGAIVEEQGDISARREIRKVSPGGIDAASANILPL